MLVNETQRRRATEKSETDRENINTKSMTSDTEKKEKLKMPPWISCTPAKIKRVIVSLVVLYLVYKIYQLLTYSQQPEIVPPDPQRAAISWKYENNPQDMDQEGLEDLLTQISRGKNVDFINRNTDEDDKKNIRKPGFDLPVVRKPYKSTGSLTFTKRQFYLNGKPFRIFSGAMHYFRVPHQHWEDRMKKMVAGGLNTLETYVSWNLHEDTPGNFSFEGMLDIRKYIQLAHELGLKVLLRPGPYICSEWDFGGLPAWLLKDPKMKVRSNYRGYQEAVERFFGKLIPLVADLQYSKGGPIIAVQIENEFGSYSSEVEHLLYLKKLLIKLGIQEMFFTSEGFATMTKTGFHNAPFYEEALPTANFKKFNEGQGALKLIEGISEDFPLVVMEFWSGWFDHWQLGRAVMGSSAHDMAINLQYILNTGASVNFYMYHGGTNFGFMAGANWFNGSRYKPDVTSYDYIAPLSEEGDLTPKYEIAREFFRIVSDNPKFPDPPADTYKGDYGKVEINHYIQLEDMLTPIKAQLYEKPVPMEMLSHNNGYGQNYGFILYRAHPTRGQKLTFTHPVQDRAQIILNGIQIATTDWFTSKWEFNIPQDKMADINILDILVENHGRVNYVKSGFNRFNEERKGIIGDVLLDGKPITEWKIYPLEFKAPYIKRIMASRKWKWFANWQGITAMYNGTLVINGTPRDTFVNMKGITAMYNGTLDINGTPRDTFVNMKFSGELFWKNPDKACSAFCESCGKTMNYKSSWENAEDSYHRKSLRIVQSNQGWTKGNVFINGFNIGRYWKEGPQRTLYVPGPFLRTGKNEIVIFELHKGYHTVVFQKTHLLG